MKNITLLSLIFIVMFFQKTTTAQIQFGVFADCQYCDCETAGTRFYRNSLNKMEECMWQFNQNKKLKFVVGMGDLIDRDFESFNKVNAILSQSKKEVFNVPGNHDFVVEKEEYKNVAAKLNLTSTYHTFTKKKWQFIFLNGNEINFNSPDPDIVNQAEKTVEKLTEENKPNAYKWNGGMSDSQIEWLDQQLKNATQKNLNVVIFCHYPLLPFEAHALWNSEKVLAVLQKYNNVKLWMNGHNHHGNYVFHQGTHFVNLVGMVETENDNAFAEVTLFDNKIEIKSFGREKSRTLEIQ